MKQICLFFFLLTAMAVQATHNRAGEITYRHISGLTYQFTVTIYADPTSPAFQRRLIEINWGDNTPLDSISQSSVTPITGNVSKREFISRHTFPAPGNYAISVSDPNRNGGIDNIDNSSAVPFHITSLLRISSFGNASNNSPELLNDPIDDACVGQLFIHNPGAYDVDGDSLAYRIARSRGIGGDVAPGFTFPPASNRIYVDALTGDLIWDRPSSSGTYNVAIKIQEYRNGVLIGEVTRDMQIEVIPGCNNQPPQIIADEKVCIEANRRLKSPIAGTDPDNDLVILEVRGEPLELNQSPAVFSNAQAANPNRDTLYWNTNCDHVRIKPYRISIKATDDASSRGSTDLTSFKTQDIQIIGPAPRNFSASSFRDEINLSWNPAPCLNAIGYKLYRRFDSSGFVPGSCQVGVPNNIGYVKIADLNDRSITNFLDDGQKDGLIPGRRYCYLITAVFPDGGEGYASAEVCAQIDKFVPVMTKVSVAQTDANNGIMDIAWSPPDSIDVTAFPPPYRYLIYEMRNGENLIDSTLSINDTTYQLGGINTSEQQYNFKVKLFSYGSGKIEVGESPAATSIFLNLRPLDNRINLNWSVNVPWENDSFIVFRKLPNQNTYDSIATVTETTYTDINLANGAEYCYYVQSTGDYELKSVPSPIINLSQRACAIPIDLEPPCSPTFTLNANCDSNFVVISWQDSLVSCSQDIVQYNIYRSKTRDGDFELLDQISQTQSKQYRVQLASIAGCYLVSAIDSAGNESTSLNRSCVDYCPRYELPNIFTPNGDGINDLFVPYPNYRYVDSIDLKIWNRWGQVVYTTTNPDILWDGNEKQSGNMVSEGVYFFDCVVYERSLDGTKPRVIKGTVNVHEPKNGFKKTE